MSSSTALREFRSACGTRLLFIAIATLAVAPLALARPTAAPVPAKVYLTVPEALKLVFPGCDIERGTTYLTKEQEKRVAKLSGAKVPWSIIHPYTATKDGKLVGTAYFDTHVVRSLKETLMIVVDAKDRVRRIEVLAFGEPEEYLPRGKWYAQFVGHGLDKELTLKRKISGITGATLSARATTRAVRRTLALHRVIREAPDRVVVKRSR